MPVGWQLTPERKYFLANRMACGVTLLQCQRQLPLCQLRNRLSIVHFYFNSWFTLHQTFSGSQTDPLCHMPRSGRQGADRKPPWLNKPQLMPACHFSHPCHHLWYVLMTGQDQIAGNGHRAGFWTSPWRHGLNHQHLTNHKPLCEMYQDAPMQGAN